MKYCRLVYFAMVAWWILWAALFYWVFPPLIRGGNQESMKWWAVVNDSLGASTVPIVQDRILGEQFVYRITFTLLIFHLIIGLLSLGAESSSPRPFMAIHRKGMPWKFLGQCVLWFAFTNIPNKAFEVINWITGIFSGFYVVAQFVVLMETSYRLNEKLLSGSDKSVPAIVYTIIVYLATIALIVLGFYFPLSARVGDAYMTSLENILGIMITTTVLIIIILIVTLLIETATIVASSTVSLFLAAHACLLICTLMNSGDTCLYGGSFSICPSDYITAIQSIEIVLLAITAFFGAISMISISVLFGAAKTKYSEYDGYDSGDDEEAGEPSYAYYGFHVVCMAVGCYLTVIFSHDSEMPYCLGIGSALGALLYIWTLVAPKLLPDRDFGV